MFNLGTLFNMFGGQNTFVQRLNQFNQLVTQQGNGSAEQQVNKFLSSGRMTQDQFNTYGQIATQVLDHFRGNR